MSVLLVTSCCGVMTKVTFCLLVLVLTGHCYGVSSKLDFGDETQDSVITNSTNVDNEDVEVKHTIVVATKFKNNNRRGIHGTDDSRPLTYNIGRSENSKNEDSGEVPVLMGYKATDTTRIRTPDTRYKTPIYPEAVFINRNIRDDYDIYPNTAINSNQWKPSTHFNNINWWGQDRRSYVGRNRLDYEPKINRKFTNDGMAEYYCRRCKELSSTSAPCAPAQQYNSRRMHEATTQKVKIDGKLAKLN